MCLFSKDKDAKVATKNIPVIKIIIPYKKDQWEAVFQVSIFNYGYNKDNRNKSVIYDPSLLLYRIGSGFFHSYSVSNNINIKAGNKKFGYEVVNCIIPKDALYYEGINNDYASDRLIVGRPIKTITKERTRKLKWIKIKRKILDFMVF